MNQLLLLGGGGHCRSCIDVIESEGKLEIFGIVLTSVTDQVGVLGYPVVGDDSQLPRLILEVPQVLIAVGQIKSAKQRISLYQQLKQMGASFPIVLSSSAYVSRHASIEEGTIVMHGAVINAEATIGVNSIINSQSLIEHGATVGRHCHISTGACINGDVIIEQGCFIGSGVVIKQGVRIGENSIISAGSTVLQDIPPNTILKINV